MVVTQTSCAHASGANMSGASLAAPYAKVATSFLFGSGRLLAILEDTLTRRLLRGSCKVLVLPMLFDLSQASSPS